MSSERPDLTTLALRLELIADRLDKLEVRVRTLVTSQIVEAQAFVVKDDRSDVRARLVTHKSLGGPTD